MNLTQEQPRSQGPADAAGPVPPRRVGRWKERILIVLLLAFCFAVLWLSLAPGRAPVAASARLGIACLLIYLHWNLVAGEGSLVRLITKQLVAWLIFHQVALCTSVLLWARRASAKGSICDAR